MEAFHFIKHGVYSNWINAVACNKVISQVNVKE